MFLTAGRQIKVRTDRWITRLHSHGAIEVSQSALSQGVLVQGVERINRSHLKALRPQYSREGARATGTVEHSGTTPLPKIKVEHRQRLLPKTSVEHHSGEFHDSNLMKHQHTWSPLP